MIITTALSPSPFSQFALPVRFVCCSLFRKLPPSPPTKRIFIIAPKQKKPEISVKETCFGGNYVFNFLISSNILRKDNLQKMRRIQNLFSMLDGALNGFQPLSKITKHIELHYGRITGSTSGKISLSVLRK